MVKSWGCLELAVWFTVAAIHRLSAKQGIVGTDFDAFAGPVVHAVGRSHIVSRYMGPNIEKVFLRADGVCII